MVACLFAWLLLSHWSLRGHDDPGDSGGGGRPGRPSPEPPPAPDGPAWWPEFEREFAAYVAAVDVRSGAEVSARGGQLTHAP